jgi:putative addiction module component (TIGR02574 family)
MATVTVESLLEQAKALSDADRAKLAQRLYETLPPLPEMPEVWDNEEEAEAAWQEEFQRRLDDVERGTGDCLPLDEAMAEIRAARMARRQS